MDAFEKTTPGIAVFGKVTSNALLEMRSVNRSKSNKQKLRASSETNVKEGLYQLEVYIYSYSYYYCLSHVIFLNIVSYFLVDSNNNKGRLHEGLQKY